MLQRKQPTYGQPTRTLCNHVFGLGDEQSAHECLERLTSRFGSENERVMALRGLFQEAIAEDDTALERVLEEYDSILARDQTNMV